MVLHTYLDAVTSIDWVRRVPQILTEKQLTQDCRGTTVGSNISQIVLATGIVTIVYAWATAALGKYLASILSDSQLQLGLYTTGMILVVVILIYYHFVS